LAILSLFLIWVQLAQYLGGVEVQQFSINGSIDREITINLDITVITPCNGLRVDVQDVTQDTLFVTELVSFQETEITDYAHAETFVHRAGTVAQNRAPGIHRALSARRAKRVDRKSARKHVRGGQACRIYGSFPVNRVQGQLQITAAGHYFRGPIGVEADKINFTHIIDEFSFGEYYPKLVNPLDDGLLSVADSADASFKYFLSVVPTTYVSYSTGRTVRTNQYAVTEHAGVSQRSTATPPGLFFSYDFEPIMLTITDKRVPFSQFAVRLVNIVGGLIVSIGWLYRVSDTYVFSTRPKEAHYGILDMGNAGEEFRQKNRR
jgi:hypothetical protein